MAREKTFQEVCCEKLGIPEAAYEKAVLWRCLPRRHLPVGKIRWLFNRGYFKADLAIIRSVKNCTSLAALNVEVQYHRLTKPHRGFQRRVLRARLSGQRLVNFASKMFPSKKDSICGNDPCTQANAHGHFSRPDPFPVHDRVDRSGIFHAQLERHDRQRAVQN